MKMAQVFINRRNSVPAFYNRILNVQILQCNNHTSGKALRGYHLDKPQSSESLFSLYVMLSISNDWPSPINSTSKTSLISISHPIITREHYFFSSDYQFPYWSLQFLFLTTKMYSTQLSRYIFISTVLREKLLFVLQQTLEIFVGNIYNNTLEIPLLHRQYSNTVQYWPKSLQYPIKHISFLGSQGKKYWLV